MSLPTAWVDKIFSKLTLTYGRDFLGRWEGVSLADVKTDWAHELSGFENWPEAIAFALTNLPTDKPPTVQAFKAMAHKAPKPERAQLPAPKADPARVAAELAKLAPVRAQRGAKTDFKAWAKSLHARHEAGEILRPIQVRFYREALGMPMAKEAA